jgi:hypothetical protein
MRAGALQSGRRRHPGPTRARQFNRVTQIATTGDGGIYVLYASGSVGRLGWGIATRQVDPNCDVVSIADDGNGNLVLHLKNGMTRLYTWSSATHAVDRPSRSGLRRIGPVAVLTRGRFAQ